MTGQRRNLITASYDIRPDDWDGYFEAYVAALERGFSEFALDNLDLIRLIDEVYREALEVYG